MEEQQRTLIITGASRGVGRACAHHLAGLGWRLLLVARKAAPLDALCHELNQSGTIATATCADLSSAEGIQDFCQSLESDGQIFSGLVHAAGISWSAKGEDFDAQAILSMFTLNCLAFQAISATLLPSLKAKKSGHLIAIASVAGLRGYPYISSYAASKHALVGVVRSLAKEVARYQIRVNALCPGYLDTDMTAENIAAISQKTGRTAQEARQSLEALSPQKRLFSPEEVAQSVAFLMSEGAAGISGQALPICGAEIA